MGLVKDHKRIKDQRTCNLALYHIAKGFSMGEQFSVPLGGSAANTSLYCVNSLFVDCCCLWGRPGTFSRAAVLTIPIFLQFILLLSKLCQTRVLDIKKGNACV